MKRVFTLKSEKNGLDEPDHLKTIIVTSKTPDKKQTGLRVYKPEKCFNGYTLFLPQTLGEITPLGYIYLIDINGDIIYQWMTTKGSPVFAQLKPDGNIIYNDIDYSGLQELDLQSNMVWNYPGLIDHDFRFLKDNNFLITRLENEDDGCSAGFSRIEIVTADKKVLWQWKAEEHIEELERLVGLKTPIGDWANDTCKILKDTPLVKKDSLFRIGDWALINTCEILKDTPLAKNDFRFKEGNIIFSFDILSAIGIIDYPSGEIVWAWGSGILERQHTPTMLDNGNILIFDNGTKRGWSRVIELNPITEQIVWEYHAEPKEDFFSSWMSSATRLPNGNTLICESTSNRIFEITPQGEIVWDFISTFHKTTGVGEGIYRAYRYSPEYVQPLLDKINQWQNQQKATIIR